MENTIALPISAFKWVSRTKSLCANAHTLKQQFGLTDIKTDIIVHNPLTDNMRYFSIDNGYISKNAIVYSNELDSTKLIIFCNKKGEKVRIAKLEPTNIKL
jgi:hypothetical protein